MTTVYKQLYIVAGADGVNMLLNEVLIFLSQGVSMHDTPKSTVSCRQTGISFTRFSFIVLVPTFGFTEQDYSVMEEGGEVTVCLVVNIAVLRATPEESNLTLGTQDGPIAIGEMCLPIQYSLHYTVYKSVILDYYWKGIYFLYLNFMLC